MENPPEEYIQTKYPNPRELFKDYFESIENQFGLNLTEQFKMDIYRETENDFEEAKLLLEEIIRKRKAKKNSRKH